MCVSKKNIIYKKRRRNIGINQQLAANDKTNWQNIDNDVDLNYTISKSDRKDIRRLLHPATEEKALFSMASGPLVNTDHILSHKASPYKLQMIKSIQYLL